MSELYRAHDEKLGRDIALEVLPEGTLWLNWLDEVKTRALAH
jgi:hypothetical protein